LVIKRGRLRWFGPGESQNEDHWVKHCMTMEADRKRQGTTKEELAENVRVSRRI